MLSLRCSLRFRGFALAALSCVGVVLGWSGRGSSEEPTTFPPEARSRYDKGDELLKKELYREAIAEYDAAIKLGMVNYPRVYLHRAEAVRGLNNYDLAIAQYTSFIEKFGIEESCRY